MLDTIVRYLHDSLLPFRLSSYPSPERMPLAAPRHEKNAVEVETRLVRIADKPVILCFAEGDTPDLNALGNEMGAPVVDATDDDVPEALRRFDAPPPPLGQLFGIPLVMDDRIADAPAIVFRVLDASDYIEIPHEDFMRQEQPRIASFTRRGELPVHREEQTGHGVRP